METFNWMNQLLKSEVNSSALKKAIMICISDIYM